MRVQGLRLGGQLTLTHSTSNIVVTLNEPISITTTQPVGVALDLRVTAQPEGQTCALSELAPSTIPETDSPIFVRCVHNEVAHVTMPETLPNDPLQASFGIRDLAYPGIPYESRPGVVGGIFPYEYRLTGLTLNGVAQNTTGVSLDFRRGTVRFTPASEGTYVVSVQIKDSGAAQKTLNQNFTIQSAASRFVFVAPSGADTAGRGTKVAPYKTLAYAIANNGPDKLVYLRKGTYVTGGFLVNDAKAKQFLAYPDEVATLDLNKAGNINVRSSALPAPRLEDIDVSNVMVKGIFADPSSAGLVVRNVRWVNGQDNSTEANNASFIFTAGGVFNAIDHRLLVQENDFGTYTTLQWGGFAMILYETGYSIVENNQVRLGSLNAGALYDKRGSQYNTFRETYVERALNAEERVGSGIWVNARGNSVGEHIHHNLLVNANLWLGQSCFESDGCYLRNHDVHHNTLVGDRVVVNGGPFNTGSYGTRVSHNIISNGTSAPFGGLSCTSRPANWTSKVSYAANLLETTSPLAHKDNECTGNNVPWAEWQGTYGFDTPASGSTHGAPTVLIGSGPTTGLPSGDARRTQRGHQY